MNVFALMKNIKITIKENRSVRDHSLHHLARKKGISQKKKKKKKNKCVNYETLR